MYKRIKVWIIGRENRTYTYTGDKVGKTTTAQTVDVVETTDLTESRNQLMRRELPRLRDLTTLTADRSVDDIFEITDGRDAEEDLTIGPYNAAALAGRALDLGAGVSKDYLDGFVAGLKDLHNLSRLPEPRRRKRRK